MSNITWLTGVSNDYTREAAQSDLYGRLGILLGPETFGGPGTKANYAPHIPDYHAWACDNGCFSNHGGFEEQPWLDRLRWIYENVENAWECCLFAVAPDVFRPDIMRGDPRATIQRSLPVLPRIRDIGVPAALVFQDGLEDFPLDSIPWDDFDVAFIGGGDHFKLAYPHDWTAGDPTITYDRNCPRTRRFMELMWRCHCEGKSIHVGRVNTKIRLAYSILIGANSADGTLIGRAGREGLDRIRRWMPALLLEQEQ